MILKGVLQLLRGRDSVGEPPFHRLLGGCCVRGVLTVFGGEGGGGGIGEWSISCEKVLPDSIVVGCLLTVHFVWCCPIFPEDRG